MIRLSDEEYKDLKKEILSCLWLKIGYTTKDYLDWFKKLLSTIDSLKEEVKYYENLQQKAYEVYLVEESEEVKKLQAENERLKEKEKDYESNLFAVKESKDLLLKAEAFLKEKDEDIERLKEDYENILA